MRRTLRFAVMMCAAVWPAHAQTQTDGAGWGPVLELRVVSSTPEGSRAGASNSWTLGQNGEPIVATVWTGATLCQAGIAGADLPSYARAEGSVWRLNGEYLGLSDGRHQIRLTSRFERLAGRDRPLAPTTQVLTLREGDTVALDALSAPVGDKCSTHTVVMETRLLMRPADPELARTRYAAELWMIHTDPGGQQQREKLLVNLDGSAAVPFLFGTLRFPLPQLDPRQGDIAGVIELAGSLRARTRTDGQVDLDIDTRPFMFTMHNPARPSTFVTEPSRKTVTVTPEETTAIDFPPPKRGMTSVALDAARSGSGSSGGSGMRLRARGDGTVEGADAPASAIEIKKDRLVMNTAEFFKGHRTQLLITLRRLR